MLAKLKEVAMFLSSGDPDMYDGALFSYQGDFLDYLQLEDSCAGGATQVWREFEIAQCDRR